MNGTNFITTLVCYWMFFRQMVITVFNTGKSVSVAQKKQGEMI